MQKEYVNHIVTISISRTRTPHKQQDRRATKTVCDEKFTTKRRKVKKKKKKLPVLLRNNSDPKSFSLDVPETNLSTEKRKKRRKKKKKRTKTLDDIDVMNIKISEDSESSWTPSASSSPTWRRELISERCRRRAQTSRRIVRSTEIRSSPYDEQPFRKRSVSRRNVQRKSAPGCIVRPISRYSKVDVEESRRKAEERIAASRREEKRKMKEFLSRKSKYDSNFLEKSRLLAQERVAKSRQEEGKSTVSSSQKQQRGSNVDLEEVLRRTKQRLKKRDEALRRLKQAEMENSKQKRFENFDPEEMIRQAQQRVKQHQEKMSPKKLPTDQDYCNNFLLNLVKERSRFKSERTGQKELREQRRAEIYAMNMIMRAWNEQKMASFDAERRKKKKDGDA